MKERRRSCGHSLNAGGVAALFPQGRFYRQPHSLITQTYFVETDGICGLIRALEVSFFLKKGEKRKRKRKRMGLEKETKAEESFPPAGL
jgi:hypothetical protein